MGEVDDKELRLTIDDIRTVCEMGRYFADKIRGATYVALARETRSGADREKAIAALSRAAEHCKGYVALVTANHVGQIWFNRVGTLNFENQIEDTEHDTNLARQIELK